LAPWASSGVFVKVKILQASLDVFVNVTILWHLSGCLWHLSGGLWIIFEKIVLFFESLVIFCIISEEFISSAIAHDLQLVKLKVIYDAD
jgi:hypothetical protein